VRGRQVTTGITLVVLCGLVVAGAVLGVNFLFAKAPNPAQLVETPTPTSTCVAAPRGTRLSSTKVEVSVFNAGSRAGLADHTLTALSRRGFQTGEVGNAPAHVHVRRVQVWTTRSGDPAARLVARQFGRHVQVTVTQHTLGAGINVVVGNRFHGLVHAPRSIKLRHPERVCITSTPASAR
jgi:hypothetical protein